MLSQRQILLRLYTAALAAVAGDRVTANYLQQHPWQSNRALAVIACGKAAAAMARGAQSVLGERIVHGLLVTKRGYLAAVSLPEQWHCLEAGHPLPDEDSLEAGRQLLDFVGKLPVGMPLLVLISGGTSALLEVLPPGVTLADLRRVNEWLLAGGADIRTMNRIRKSLSCIKGGGLCGYLGRRPVLNLMISDVQGDDPAVIGSGLLTPESGPEPVLPDLPAWLRLLLQAASACKQQPVSFPEIKQRIIANNRDACEAAAQIAGEIALSVQIHAPRFGPLPLVAGQLTDCLLAAEPGIHIWGGEPTLDLPENPGRGGRNQHLALSLAQALQGHDEITVLCGATDGSDGPTEDAGALVDSRTVQQGIDYPGGVKQALARADSGHFLEEVGALISTGPTGTNVMDLVIALKTGPRAE